MLAAAPSPLHPGALLDRYELLAPVARGGMGVVWVARLAGKRGFEKLVAIKTVLTDRAHDPGFQSMFLDEARLASRISHANVAQILDLGEQGGVLYLVLEWVDGESLSQLVKHLRGEQRTMPLGIALRVLADICGGLHAAHELRATDGAPLNVVHRDVSPQNILLTNDGVAKLIDFGIAKAEGRATGETGTGVVKGKAHYMSPEQALGEPVDRRADIWAVGAVLHFMLTGRVPYEADSPIITLGRVMRGDTPGPLPPDTPPPVRRLLARLMAFAVETRIATAADAQREIEQTMRECGVITTTSDVGAYFRETLGPDHERRRREIDALLREPPSANTETAPDGAVPRSDTLPFLVPSAPPPALMTLESAVVSRTQSHHVLRSPTVWIAGAVTLALLSALTFTVRSMRAGPDIEPAAAATPSPVLAGSVTSPAPSPLPVRVDDDSGAGVAPGAAASEAARVVPVEKPAARPSGPASASPPPSPTPLPGPARERPKSGKAADRPDWGF